MHNKLLKYGVSIMLLGAVLLGMYAYFSSQKTTTSDTEALTYGGMTSWSETLNLLAECKVDSITVVVSQPQVILILRDRTYKGVSDPPDVSSVRQAAATVQDKCEPVHVKSVPFPRI